MSYLEIKAIKAIAAVHRGTVNLAIVSLAKREKLAHTKRERKLLYAADLEKLANVTLLKASDTKLLANIQHTDEIKKINAATTTVQNLKDDLNKIS